MEIKTYQEAAKLAEKRKLRLAEYGDGADYSTAEAYCYWNKTGNRRDEPEIYIEYDFDKENESGKQTNAGTVHFADVKEGRKYVVLSPYENERKNPFVTIALSATEAAKKINPALRHMTKNNGRGYPCYTAYVFTGWKDSQIGKYFDPPENCRPVYFYDPNYR